MTIKTPQQLAAEYTRTMPQPDSVRARDWIAERIILAVQEDRRQMEVFTAQAQRAHGIAVIRSLNELTTAQAGNPEYLRGQAELLASLTSGGDMDTALASTYAELGVAAL